MSRLPVLLAAVRTSNQQHRRPDRRALVLRIQWAKPIRKTPWLLAARAKGDKGRGGPGAEPLMKKAGLAAWTSNQRRQPPRPPSPGFANKMGEAHPQNALAVHSQGEGRQRSRGTGGRAPDEKSRGDCPDLERQDGGTSWVDHFTQALAGDLAPHLLMAQRLLREVA